jgi:hypothetical protein
VELPHQAAAADATTAAGSNMSMPDAVTVTGAGLGRPTGPYRYGGVAGASMGHRPSSLAALGPAERAAWVAAARQRQQQLYGRFIELALQGQQAAAVGGHLGLQQLMALVRECIREEMQGQQVGGSGECGAGAAGGEGGSGAGGSAARAGRGIGSGGAREGRGRGAGANEAGNRAVDVMRLIRKVQLRHQQLLLQGKGLTTAAGSQKGVDGVQGGSGGAGGSGAALVARQRLFVAFLNVAHQTNLAAAAAAGAEGAAAGAAGVSVGMVIPGAGKGVGGGGGPQGNGKGRKRSHAGVPVEGDGIGSAQQANAFAAVGPTKIFLT